jgi:hypothetical protein
VPNGKRNDDAEDEDPDRHADNNPNVSAWMRIVSIYTVACAFSILGCRRLAIDLSGLGVHTFNPDVEAGRRHARGDQCG